MPVASGAKTKPIRKVKVNGTVGFDNGNRTAAFIISQDEERYAGLPLMWAKRWIAAHPEPDCLTSEMSDCLTCGPTCASRG